jgi:uncharacterized protein
MSIEVRPVGVSCQLQCTYCYEEGMREKQRTHRYDREAVLASINKLGPKDHFSLFGGECLILPLEQIEELLKLAYERSGSSGLQTNGALITDAHIDAFIKYKSHIGISLDGPDELNDSRWAGTLEATRKQTARTHWAINRLIERSKEYPHLMPSFIVTAHAGNWSKERWPRFLEWLHELDAKGVKYVNIHVMELDHKADTLYLPPEELWERLLELWDTKFTNIKISKFEEILKLLRETSDNVVCHWKPCDPWNTSAVKGIENDGAPSHCSRTNKDGTNWLPAEGSGDTTRGYTNFIGWPGSQHFERQLALYVTPQEHGGCKGCEYWLMCYGNCPGEGMTGDWRMRSSYCALFKKMFNEGAKRLRAAGVVPFCDHPQRQQIEEEAYRMWAQQQSIPTLNQLRLHVEKKETASQTNSPMRRVSNYADTQASYSDGHGDAHGDFTDSR